MHMLCCSKEIVTLVTAALGCLCGGGLRDVTGGLCEITEAELPRTVPPGSCLPKAAELETCLRLCPQIGLV